MTGRNRVCLYPDNNKIREITAVHGISNDTACRITITSIINGFKKRNSPEPFVDPCYPPRKTKEISV